MEQVNIGFILLNIGYAIHHADWNYQRVSSPFARISLCITFTYTNPSRR